MIARRSFLASMLAAAAAPAIVRAGSLMKIVVPSDEILLPKWFDNYNHSADALRDTAGRFLRDDGSWAAVSMPAPKDLILSINRPTTKDSCPIGSQWIYTGADYAAYESYVAIGNAHGAAVWMRS